MSVNGHFMRELFREQGYGQTYHKGHVICFQGDRFTQVFMVVSGIVKLYDIDETGSERTISFIAHPDVFPVIWLMREPPPVHLYYYEAVTDADCLMAPVEAARDFVSRRPAVLASLMDSLTQTYINSLGRVQNLEKSRLHERLEFVLYWLARRVGSVHGHIARIDAIVTQEDIARLAGVTRESMSLAINKLASGIIWREDHSTYIDLSKLPLNSMPTVFPKYTIN